MDFSDTPEIARFRAQAREWLAAHAPRFTPSSGANDREIARLLKGWQGAKAAAGYAGFTVPKEYGGRGGSFIEVVFSQEAERYPIAQVNAPYLPTGVGNAIPVMIAHASSEVRAQLLRPTLYAEILWAQLFSEPGAGSDVAGIRTRAVRDGDDWVINGQKVWSSGAHVADWSMLIARSNPDVPKHKGITYFFLDMRTPGIEVRPLRQITGRSEFNEVFFTDVRIPDRYRIGPVDGGWSVIVTTLLNERYGAMTGSAAAFGGSILEPLVRLARGLPGAQGGSLMTDDPLVRAKLADYHVTLAGIRALLARLTTVVARGGQPGSEGAITKYLMTRYLQDMAAFGLDLAGPAAGAVQGALAAQVAAIADSFLGSVGYRQGGGTEDVVKNIIAERTLGLPPDPRNDKDVAFNKMPAAERTGR
jgi:alkylation response protein AidB-like acyl-CoA dehydrogenase